MNSHYRELEQLEYVCVILANRVQRAERGVLFPSARMFGVEVVKSGIRFDCSEGDTVFPRRVSLVGRRSGRKRGKTRRSECGGEEKNSIKWR